MLLWFLRFYCLTNYSTLLQGRLAAEITKEELASCFNMPSEEAAKHLGIGLTVLKRLCRKFGVPRWPYRMRRSVERLIKNVEVGVRPELGASVASCVLPDNVCTATELTTK